MNANEKQNSPQRRTIESDAASTRRPTVRLEYERNAGRRMGFLGFSIVAHLAFLTALAFMPQNLKPIQEIGGGDGLPAGLGKGAEAANDSEISIVEVDASGNPVAPTDATSEAPAAPMLTNSEADAVETVAAAPVKQQEQQTVKPVAAHQNLPIKKAAQKPALVAKIEAAKSAPTAEAPENSTAQSNPQSTEESAESQVEAPVLLANPPEDKPEAQPEEPTEEASPEVTTVATTESAAKEEATAETAPAALAETKTETIPEEAPEKSEAPTAAAATVTQTTKSEAAPADETKAIAAAGGAQSDSGKGKADSGTGSTQKTEGSGSGAVIAGPIRDASELKALPGNPNPVYPPRDRLNRKQGTAFVLGRVMPDGRIGQVVLEKSSGSPSMDAESAKAFRNWRFQPGQQGWVRKPFQFRLVGEAKEVPAQLGKTLKRQ